MNVLERLRAAFAAATPEGGDAAAFAAAVRPSTDPKFGDYQANGCMALAKALEKNPRELAQDVAAARRPRPRWPARPRSPGPGFLNVRLRDDWIAADARRRCSATSGSGLRRPAQPKTVVIDYSSPNVAKPMHVGHIRSTVIGESLARIFAALGHKVVRDNHLGDWGSQFGMILWGWKNAPRRGGLRRRPGRPSWPGSTAWPRIEDQGRRRGRRGGRPRPRPPSSTPATPRTARSGSSSCPTAWGRCRRSTTASASGSTSSSARASTTRCSPTSSRTWRRRGSPSQSEGATVVFAEGIEGPVHRPQERRRLQLRDDRPGDDPVPRRDLEPRPGPLRRRPPPGRPLQAALRRRPALGLRPVDLEHVAFGTILGADRRPFKTREGDVVGLESLLDEAVAEARKVVDENSPDLDPEEQRDGSPRSSAWGRSSTPTSRRTGSATTSSTGRKCWP